MKPIIFITVLLSAAISGEATAACNTGTHIISAALTTLLQGRTACKRNATNTAWDWQEYHSGTSGQANNLIDWKKGVGDPVDPTQPVGTWSTNVSTRAGTVTYNYGTGGTYSYNVYTPDGTTYNFCTSSGGTDITGVTIKIGQVVCGSLP